MWWGIAHAVVFLVVRRLYELTRHRCKNVDVVSVIVLVKLAETSAVEKLILQITKKSKKPPSLPDKPPTQQTGHWDMYN